MDFSPNAPTTTTTTSTLRTRTLDDFLADNDDDNQSYATNPSSTTTTAPVTTIPPPTQTTEKRTRAIHTKPPTKDWMVVQGNAHYARDQSAFLPGIYKPVSQTLSSNIFDPSSETHVAGIGTVRIAVQTGPAPDDTGVLELHDVLHVPEAVCNGFNPLLYGSSMSCYEGWWEGRVPGKGEGRPDWVARPFAGGARLVLRGRAEEDGVGSEIIPCLDGGGGFVGNLSLYVSREEMEGIRGG